MAKRGKPANDKEQLEAFRKTIAGGNKLERTIKENKVLKAQLEATTEQLEQARKSRGLAIPEKTRKRKKPKTFARVILGDTHGSHAEKGAVSALLNDIEAIDVREVVHLGDGLECGGWLAQKHTLGYVSQIDESVYEDDVAATNDLLDHIQKRAPHAEIHYMEGNHEQRVERWCVDACEGNKRNAEFLLRAVSPEKVLNLEKRGIKYYRIGECHGGLLERGTLKLGKSFFTHGFSCAKHAASKTLDKFAACVFYGHCFSDDTELLTRDGWKKYTDLSVGDLAATVNMETGQFEHQPIKDVWTHDHYTEMVKIKSRSIDALVTEDHAMVLMSPNVRRLGEATTGKRKLRRVKAKDVSDLAKAAIPLAAMSDNQSDYDISDDMIRLIGWIVSEGCIEEGNDHIRIAQSDIPGGGVEELDDLLPRMNIDFSKIKRYDAGSDEHGQHRNYDAYRYGLSSKSDAVKEYHTRCPEKKLQKWMTELSARQFEILLDTLIMADGSISTTSENSVQFASNIDSDIDILQELCAKHGKRSSHIVRYRNGSRYNVLTICERGFTHVSSEKISVVPYSGDVWCCSVDNQTLIVRRNGKVFVAGNTHRADYSTTRMVGVGLVAAWCPGCICQLQPRWRHNDPSGWTHGYILQIVNESDGTFHAMHVPIDNGRSYLTSLLTSIS